MNTSRKTVPTPANAVEMLPDALEIEQARLPWFARIGTFWIFLIVASVIAWACLGQVDIIVKARGKVVSDRGDIIMKPLDSAIIKSIEVHKGDIVEAGQVLIHFDPALNQAEVDRLQREIEVLDTQLIRYTAEFEGRDYAGGPTQTAEWQKSIYLQRVKYYQEKLNYYKSNHERIKAAQDSTRQSYATYKEILSKNQEIEDMYKQLRGEDNAVSYKELLEVTMTRMQNTAEVDRLRNQLVDYEHQILSLEAERNAFIEEWRNSISEKMVTLSRELDSDRKQLAKALSLVSYVSLTAPCRAIVHEMAAFPVGSAVGEAEAVITLVPLDGTLEVEAEVRPQDIARVHLGSEARIKLNAFPFQKHGTLDGKIRLISSNTFSRQGMAPAQSSDDTLGSTYYRANLVVSGRLRNINDDFTLIPGMETEVEIKTGRRRIIEYLVYPLIKGLDEAFREP